MDGAVVFFQLWDLISTLALPVFFGGFVFLFFFWRLVHVGGGCGLLKVGVGSGELSAVVGLFKPWEVVSSGHKRAAPAVWRPRPSHGERFHRPRLGPFHIVPMLICFCSILALSGVFYLMLTRYLDKENASTSCGAPSPLEEAKVVYKGKVY